jgi:hypothetical protein
MATKQSSAFHETLPDSGTFNVGNAHLVLDPLGTGRYMLATSGSDGLGEAWPVESGGVLHLNDDDTGARSMAYFSIVDLVLI